MVDFNLINGDLIDFVRTMVNDPTTPFTSFALDDEDASSDSLLDTLDVTLSDGRCLRMYFVAMPGLWTIEERCPRCGGDTELSKELTPCVECYDNFCGWYRRSELELKTYVHFEETPNRVKRVLSDLAQHKLTPFFCEEHDLLTSTFYASVTLDLFRYLGKVSSDTFEPF